MNKANVVEEAIIRLIKKERFFANLISYMRRTYVGDDHPVKTAGVNITDQINLYVNLDFFANPFMLGELTEEQIEAQKQALGDQFDKWFEGYEEKRQKLGAVKNPTKKQIEMAQEFILVHECLHILNTHIDRAKTLDTSIEGEDGKKYNFTHQAMNIAMDCAINQLGNYPQYAGMIGGITLDSFAEMIGKKPHEIKAKETFEYYYNLMKQNSEELIKKYGQGLEGAETHDDHGQWQEGETASGEVAKGIIQSAVKKASQNTGAGNIPGDVQLLINELFDSKVNWKQHIRRFMQGFLKYTKKQTRSKRNRKYGILQPGKKKKYHAHLAIAVDTSGSMSDEDLKRCFTEIHKIATTTHCQLTVIEADADVTQVYPFDPKKSIEVKGRGGTAYQPAFDKAVELGVNGVIYLGDMDAFDTPKDPKIPVLWGVIGSKQSPPADFGQTIYIDTQTGENQLAGFVSAL